MMPQLHFYVPDEVAEKIREEARNANMSVSKYLATIIQKEIHLEWPANFFSEVVGGWQGEPLTRPDQGENDSRHRHCL
ncbi:MAG: hypothetical protein QNJ45_26830 [Ardenticatenaceae bacterium]|nr:hypothetical protein [Ardenticatenaceae bacterium]